MKEVKAFVRVFMGGDVIKALRHEGFHRVTVLDVSALSDPYCPSDKNR